MTHIYEENIPVPVSNVFSGDLIAIIQKMVLVWLSVQYQGSTPTIQPDWNYKLQSMR